MAAAPNLVASATRRELRIQRGRDLAVARKRVNMTQDALAKAVGISAALLSRIENGRVEARPTRWMKLFKIIEANGTGERKEDTAAIIADWTARVESSDPVSDERRDALRGLRRAHGFSQQQVADEHVALFGTSSMDQATVSAYEQGLWEPSVERVGRMYGALRTLIAKKIGETPPNAGSELSTPGNNPADLETAYRQVLDQLLNARMEQMRLSSQARVTMDQVVQTLRSLQVSLTNAGESERKAISQIALAEAARLAKSAEADVLQALEVVKPAMAAAEKLRKGDS